MARTVAEIDGDSSGLVDALSEGKKGMASMEAEGKKLSDQLREVTDSVDKAAGAMVQKIGGPTAFKAIAGAGAAFGAAKMGVDFFLNSVEKLFKSMGDEGMKVWNDVEKALDSITGAFAKAVIGGGSAEDMGKKLVTVFSGLAKIVEALVTYGMPGLHLAFEGLVTVMETVNRLTGDGVKQFNDLQRAQDTYASATSIENITKLTTAYGQLSEKVKGLVGDEVQLALAANDRTIAEERAAQKEFLKVGNIMKDLAIRQEVEKSRKVIEAVVKSEVDNIDFSKFGAAWEIERDREFAERVQTRTSELYSSIAKKFAETGRDAYSFMPEALKLAYDDAAADLSLLEERGDKLFQQYLGKDAPAKTGGGGGGGAAANAKSEMDKAMEDAKEKATSLRFHFKTTAIEIVEDIQKASVESAKAASDNIDSVFSAVIGKMHAAADAGKDASDKVAESEKAAREANFNLFVSQNAKMMATELANGKKMSDVARAMIGNVVTALGDKAFTEAGLAFAVGNVGQAAALTAAGAAAYATAAFLGATAKKSGSATKATAENPSTVTTNNTNFNLRVDAAFADEEGIARAFAKAQRLAQSRYLGAASY